MIFHFVRVPVRKPRDAAAGLVAKVYFRYLELSVLGNDIIYFCSKLYGKGIDEFTMMFCIKNSRAKSYIQQLPYAPKGTHMKSEPFCWAKTAIIKDGGWLPCGENQQVFTALSRPTLQRAWLLRILHVFLSKMILLLEMHARASELLESPRAEDTRLKIWTQHMLMLGENLRYLSAISLTLSTRLALMKCLDGIFP